MINKTDRELLERAAQAADPHPTLEAQETDKGLWFSGGGDGVLWNPLTDDGDAFRLAVKLNMGVKVNQPRRCQEPNCTIVIWEDDCVRRIVVPHRGDKAAATRRAIVRCAAEIARALPIAGPSTKSDPK